MGKSGATEMTGCDIRSFTSIGVSLLGLEVGIDYVNYLAGGFSVCSIGSFANIIDFADGIGFRKQYLSWILELMPLLMNVFRGSSRVYHDQAAKL